MEQLDHNSIIDWVATTGAVGQSADVPVPPWSTPLLTIAIVVLVISGAPLFIEFGESLRRRIYWLAFLAGTGLMAVALSYRGWHTSVATCLAGVGIGFSFAFFYDRSLIKIGHREISYMLPRQRPVAGGATDVQQSVAPPPADSYLGMVSARNHWWVVAVGSCVMSWDVYLWGSSWRSVVITAFAVVAAALSGSDDGARSLPIARGQKVQFAIASIGSVMMLGLPLITYLGAYLAGKKWLVARGKHSAVRDPGERQEDD